MDVSLVRCLRPKKRCLRCKSVITVRDVIWTNLRTTNWVTLRALGWWSVCLILLDLTRPKTTQTHWSDSIRLKVGKNSRQVGQKTKSAHKESFNEKSAAAAACTYLPIYVPKRAQSCHKTRLVPVTLFSAELQPAFVGFLRKIKISCSLGTTTTVAACSISEDRFAMLITDYHP